jgi:hypothetical protein
VGNLRFVPPAERAVREAQLREAGVLAVVSSWTELTDLLLPAMQQRAAGDDRPVLTGSPR